MAEDAVRWVDGTFEPAPPPVLSDPLSGLVTGANLPTQRSDEFHVVVPKLPDADDLREALDAALEDEEPPAPQAPEPTPSEVDETPGIMRPLRQWPSAAAVARTLRATRERIQAIQVPPAERRPAGMRSGMAVVVVIVLVTVVILYFVITSLADTFSQLFG